MTTRLRSLLRSKFVQDMLALQAGKFGTMLLSLLSSVIVWRLMGPARYGDFALAQSFLVVWQSLDLTGVGTSTSVRLAVAIGARDDSAILDLMAFYVKVNLIVNTGMALLIALLGAPVAGLLYAGGERIVTLAFWLAVGTVADGLYGLVTIALQSRRSMRALALMQYANQFVLTSFMIIAVVIAPAAESLVVARVAYSYITLVMAVVVYRRQRINAQVSYPPFSAIFARARSVSPRPYWRFGVANAIDKNLAQLFTQIPLQLVGIFAGARAVGYLTLAASGIAQAGIFTTAVLDNMQAVVPQAVGRRDYAGLWRNFTRILAALALFALALYGALVLFAPVVIPPVLGSRWIPAIPALMALALYGAITTIGGIFGPLYRAFELMRRAIVVKLIALVIVMPAGALLLQNLAAGYAAASVFLGADRLLTLDLAGAGALGGAWMINFVFLISITLTVVVTLPALRNKAK
ncbi:MAG: oligosaccharide flippase family protein [Anaerolineae bacterium]|nr:oligosaccharide flippase family protein [Anaerolineae bacterium]